MSLKAPMKLNCHFDRREKSFFDPSPSLRMIDHEGLDGTKVGSPICFAVSYGSGTRSQTYDAADMSRVL
jgi:hypothetical protein